MCSQVHIINRRRLRRLRHNLIKGQRSHSTRSFIIIVGRRYPEVTSSSMRCTAGFCTSISTFGLFTIILIEFEFSSNLAFVIGTRLCFDLAGVSTLLVICVTSISSACFYPKLFSVSIIFFSSCLPKVLLDGLPFSLYLPLHYPLFFHCSFKVFFLYPISLLPQTPNTASVVFCVSIYEHGIFMKLSFNDSLQLNTFLNRQQWTRDTSCVADVFRFRCRLTIRRAVSLVAIEPTELSLVARTHFTYVHCNHN